MDEFCILDHFNQYKNEFKKFESVFGMYFFNKKKVDYAAESLMWVHLCRT